MISYYRFTLNLQGESSQISLPVRQYDTGRGLRISFADGGGPYVITDGCRAVFCAKKADGKSLINDCIIEGNSVVRYDFTEQTASCAGVVRCEICLYDPDGEFIASPKFILVVDERVIYGEDLPLSESEKSALDSIMLAEVSRAAAEDARAEAENERELAEEGRATAFKEMKEYFDSTEGGSSAGDQSYKDLVARVDDHEVRIKTLEAATCFMAGTQILMADGTKKAIENVKYGDMIKSWDVEAGEYVDVKSYGAIRTGIASKWQVHCFTGGEKLNIFETHNIFCKETGALKQSRSWSEGQTAIGYDGVESRLAFVLQLEESAFKERYVLMSENDLYFADGILCGQHAKAKIAYWSLGLFKASDEEVEDFRESAAIYDEVNQIRFDPEYLRRSLDVRTRRKAAENEMAACKRELAERDYKTIKHAQGKLSDDEHEKNVRRCDELRGRIGERETEIKGLMNEWNAIKADYPGVRKSTDQCFKEAYALDMARIKRRKSKEADAI